MLLSQPVFEEDYEIYKGLKIRERRVKVKEFLIWKSKKIIKDQKADLPLEEISKSKLIKYKVKMMDQLAGGELSIDLGDLKRRDEIGSMAKAVEVFRKNTIEKQAAEEALEKKSHDLDERVKKLNCLYGISNLVGNNRDIL